MPTATWTLTPTNTPIPIPTALPAPYCTQRPPLTILTAPDGTGRLKVTVSVTDTAWVPDNTIQTLRLVGLSNASVEIDGTELRTVGAARTFSDPTKQVTFYVKRGANRHLAFSASFGIADICGEWQSFAGGGPAID